MNINLTAFIKETLYPSLFEHLDKVFPEMAFSKKGRGWQSPKNLDGTDPRTRRADKTKVTATLPTRAIENGEGGSIDLLSLYMNLNGSPDVITAVRELCNTLALNPPSFSPEQLEKWEKERTQGEIIIETWEEQKKALFSDDPGAKAVLSYLKEERGYSEVIIRKMGLGYLSEKEGAKVNGLIKKTNEEIKSFFPYGYNSHPLSIPYYSRGRVIGFCLRSISPGSPAPKYLKTESLKGEIDSNPFALSPFHVSEEHKAVIVEGELDALRLIAEGMADVIASSGSGGLTEKKAESLKEKGYKYIILLLDNDKAGEEYTKNSLKAIKSLGLCAFVSEIPEGEGKDPDEYLRTHTIEDFKRVISENLSSFEYLYNKRLDLYNNSPKREIDYREFLDDIVALISEEPDPISRGLAITHASGGLGAEFNEHLENAIRTEAEKHRAKEAGKKAASIMEKASSEIKAGNFPEAITLIKRAWEGLDSARNGESYERILEDNTEELWESYKDVPDVFPTSFVLKNKGGDLYKLSFPSGSLSVIAAPTNHGKSRILQSLVIDALNEEGTREKGTILYFTYEENEQNVNMQFLNAFANLELTRSIGTYGNGATIKEYLRTGETRYIKAGSLEKFKAKEKEWKEKRKTKQIKIVKPETNFIEELVSILRAATLRMKVRAIFIDYLQELYVESKDKRVGRTDELKEVMVELDQIAQETNIPIIAAAQLRREVKSPQDLTNQNIADSGWIERKASEILLVWSSKEEIQDESIRKKLEDSPLSPLNAFGFGKEGRLFFKLTKSRTIPTGITAIVDINGNTGKVSISQKDKDAWKEEEERKYPQTAQEILDLYGTNGEAPSDLNETNGEAPF